MYYIISYYCTISASPLGLQLHPNQWWPRREDVWDQQHKKLLWMMSPGTGIQEWYSIATVRLLLSCITSNSFCMHSEWNWRKGLYPTNVSFWLVSQSLCKSSHIAQTFQSHLHACTNHVHFPLLFAATTHPAITREREQVGGATKDDVSWHCES